MNQEEIKKRISQIESQQRATQADLDKLKKMISEPKPQTPEQKRDGVAFYKKLVKESAGLKELKRLKNG